MTCLLVEKSCFKCGLTKPLDDFYGHPQMGDGHLNKCKTCTKRDAKRDYQRNIQDPEWVVKERVRGRDKWRRLHSTWHHDTKAAIAAKKRWRRRNPHKLHAHAVLHRAVLLGTVMKPSKCQRCGIEQAPRDLHGHHHDYNKPLDVEWICTTCHRIEHRVA